VFYTAATALFIALHANESVYLYNIVERKKKTFQVGAGQSNKLSTQIKQRNTIQKLTPASQLI